MFESVEKAKKLLEKDEIQKAFAMFKKLAEKGNAEAQYQLAQMYVSTSKGVSKSFGDHDKEYDLWLNKAAAQGHQGAQADLARRKKSSWFSKTVTTDIEKAAAEEAERKRREAEARAAKAETDEKKAIEMYERAWSKIEEKDYRTGVSLLEQAASQNASRETAAKAAYSLYTLAIDSDYDVPISADKALYGMNRAAELNHAEAVQDLADYKEMAAKIGWSLLDVVRHTIGQSKKR